MATPSYAIDGAQVVDAARQYANIPYQKLYDAWQGAANARLSSLAFGLVGSAVVGGDYEASRGRWEQQLKRGVDKWIDVIAALNKVARAHHAAEQANIPRPEGTVVTAASVGAGPPDRSSATVEEAGVLTITWGLLIENLATGAVLASASTMAPTAIMATAGWAAFSPMDDELNRATGLWGLAEKALADFPDGLVTGTDILNVGWPAGQPSRTAFDNFLYTFKQEVKDVLAAAAANKSTLDKLNTDLSQIQKAFMIEAVGVLVAMIAARALSVVPFIGPVFEAMVQVLGVNVATATTGTVGVIATAIAITGKQMYALSDSAAFAGAAPPSDDHPPSFRQVRIDWDTADPPARRRQAR